MKKLILLVLIIFAFVGFTGCSNNKTASEDSSNKETTQPSTQSTTQAPVKEEVTKEKVTIDFISNANEDTLILYKEIAEEFTKENPNITVNVSSQGKDYEALMKSNMAANSLPDVFATHGWSVARYSEYMRPLNDQPWAGDIISTMVPIVSNDKGEIFVLPIDTDQTGIVVNKSVLSEAGVDPYTIETWDDFMVACEKVKAVSKVPVGLYGKDPRTFSQFLDEMANPFYVTSKSNDYSEELVNGTFDWSLWNNIASTLANMVSQGYVNVDFMTADNDTVIQELAKDNIAFLFSGNASILSAKQYNENVDLGFIPLPAVYPDDTKQLVGGEREAIGVWKDGKHVEEALAFINFVAKKENIVKICTARGNAPAIKGVEVDLGILTSDFKRNESENIPIYPYFDRVMLPSGMWSVMQDIGAGLAAGTYTPDEASKIMEENYLRLINNQ